MGVHFISIYIVWLSSFHFLFFVKGLRALRAKNARPPPPPSELVYLFTFNSLSHVDNKSKTKHVTTIEFEILASTSIKPFLGRQMIKLSGVGADFG